MEYPALQPILPKRDILERLSCVGCPHRVLVPDSCTKDEETYYRIIYDAAMVNAEVS